MNGSSEKMDYSNFFDGNSRPHVISRLVPANTSIVAGEIINKGTNVGEIAKIGATPVPTDAYGIALEDIVTSDTETASVAVLVEGAFNLNKIVFPAGKSEIDYEIPLRNIGITFANIINSEISR